MSVRHATVEKGAIPPEFGEDNSTLLLAKIGKKSYDKYLKKNFESYLGKSELVMLEDIESEKYADKNKYRYVFYYDYEDHGHSVQRNTTTGMNQATTVTVRRFYVHDRKEEKDYRTPLTSSFFSKVMKGYIKNLNAKWSEENQ